MKRCNNLSHVYPLQIYKYLQISPNWSAWLNLVYTIYVLSAIFDCLFVLCSVSWKKFTNPNLTNPLTCHICHPRRRQDPIWHHYSGCHTNIRSLLFHRAISAPVLHHFQSASSCYNWVTTRLVDFKWTSDSARFKNCKKCLFSDWKWPFAGLPFLD